MNLWRGASFAVETGAHRGRPKNSAPKIVFRNAVPNWGSRRAEPPLRECVPDLLPLFLLVIFLVFLNFLMSECSIEAALR